MPTISRPGGAFHPLATSLDPSWTISPAIACHAFTPPYGVASSTLPYREGKRNPEPQETEFRVPELSCTTFTVSLHVVA